MIVNASQRLRRFLKPTEKDVHHEYRYKVSADWKGGR